MADVTVKRHEDFDTAFGGAMRLVRHGLGVESFGIQVFDMPPNADRYPEHDHSHDGQEEVYTVLEGVGTLTAGGDRVRAAPRHVGARRTGREAQVVDRRRGRAGARARRGARQGLRGPGLHEAPAADQPG